MSLVAETALAEDKALCDADVDAADLYLIMNLRSKNGMILNPGIQRSLIRTSALSASCAGNCAGGMPLARIMWWTL